MKVLLLVVGCLIGTVCGQNPAFLTWNTNGARWSNVATFLGQVDVLAIQEAGSLRATSRSPLPFALVEENAIIYVVDIDPRGQITETEYAGGVTAYRLNYGGQTYFMYYYDRQLDAGALATPGRDSSKQNMAIISKTRAERVYVFPPDSDDVNRVDVNRPILGIRIPGYLVFSAHTDPRPHQIVVPAASPGCFNAIVAPLQASKPATGRVIDYGVHGGPRAAPGGSLRATTQPNLLGSDHFPVRIESVANRG
ncbi:hypothetical protein ACLKA7_004696 [Drosophila subpalustris]